MNQPPFTYLTNCVGSTGAKIRAMVDAEWTITWETFIKHVPVDEVKQVFPNYSYRGEKERDGVQTFPMHIKDDYAVSFHRSKYEGKLCYYITHSAIEYIFTDQG